MSFTTIELVEKVLDEIASPYPAQSVELPEDPRGMVAEARRLIADISSRIPRFGFDISYIREKTPREEVERVSDLIEELSREFNEEVMRLLDDIENFEMLLTATIVPVTTFRIRLVSRINSLIILCNQIVNEIRRLFMAYAIYSEYKTREALSQPLGFPSMMGGGGRE